MNHGVYLNGADGNVKCCLQKKSVEVLRKVGAVNEADCVDIDTGALIFSTDMMNSLYSLIATVEDCDRYVKRKLVYPFMRIFCIHWQRIPP